MVDSITSLRGLSLSASELKTLTGWPDPLIEDYLAILDNLVTISNEIDNKLSSVSGTTGNLIEIGISGSLKDSEISAEDVESADAVAFFLAQEF